MHLQATPPRALPPQDMEAMDAAEQRAQRVTYAVGAVAGAVLLVLLCLLCSSRPRRSLGQPPSLGDQFV